MSSTYLPKNGNRSRKLCILCLRKTMTVTRHLLHVCMCKHLDVILHTHLLPRFRASKLTAPVEDPRSHHRGSAGNPHSSARILEYSCRKLRKLGGLKTKLVKPCMLQTAIRRTELPIVLQKCLLGLKPRICRTPAENVCAARHVCPGKRSGLRTCV